MMIFMNYWRLLVVLAILPGIFLIYQVNKLDTVEKEPIDLLAKLVIGGVFSTFFAYIMERIGSGILNAFLTTDSVWYGVIEYFVVVACVEEFGKYFVLKKFTWDHPAFNYRYDAIVYAVCVGMGFAIFENIEYAFSYGMANTLIRAVTAIPAHCIFAIFMGHYYGQAKYCEHVGSRIGVGYYRKIAYIIPVLLHGLYDYIASSEDGYAGWGFVIFILFLDFVAYKKIKKFAAEDRLVS